MNPQRSTTHLGYDTPCIVAKNLSWRTPAGVFVIGGISFALRSEKSGLVGKNGSGKSTLMRLIIGELLPDTGTVEVSCKLAYLPQNFDIRTDGTVSDILGISNKISAVRKVESGDYSEHLLEVIGTDWDIETRAHAELAKFRLSHIALERRISSLSSGEATRVTLVSLMIQKPEFLVLDEPTSNLDYESREALYEMIDNWHRGALIVSHDRKLLNQMGQILELSNGSLAVYGGNLETYREQRTAEDVAAMRDLTTARQLLRRERSIAQATVERQRRRAATGRSRRNKSGQARIILGVWKESSQKTTSQLRKVHERRISDALENLNRARQRIRPENSIRLDLSNTAVPAGKMIIQLHNVTFAYPDSPGRLIIRDLNLTLLGPERLAVHGPNGSGKTTLVRLITGQLSPDAGTVKLGVNNLAYLEQNVLLLEAGHTVLDNFRRLSRCQNESLARQQLSTFLFRGSDVFKQVSKLSGGERIRLALGGILSQESPPQLLILDEPTNHLDLDSIQQLESALQEYRGALIAISHDHHFLDDVGVERHVYLGDPPRVPEVAP